jgi:murein DD-endopeptidase MepM/ murein hydrolase activator NlpD
MAGVMPRTGQSLDPLNLVVRACAAGLAVSKKALLASTGLILTVSAWVAVSSVGYARDQQPLGDTAFKIHELEQAYADLQSEGRLPTKDAIQQSDRLTTGTRREQDQSRELAEIRQTMQLAVLAEERDHARDQLDGLRSALAGMQDRLGTVVAERASLQERLGGAEQRLAAATEQRDAARQVEVGLRWRIAQLEGEVRDLRGQRELAQVWLKDWVLGSTEALEQLFGETGVDVEALIARADGTEMGQGGPLQVAAPGPASPGDRLAHLALPSLMQDDLQRLTALQRLARTLPLAPPLDHFFLTSGFGKRRDPFTQQLAFHPGLDFGATRGAKVLATAPGRVIHAGPAGPYGNMVEIDHGMGVVTRYGHLKKVTVAAGDDVRFRQEVGVIGNTGRSTAVHLHYEVRIDDVAYDPARFLHAGRFLVGIFANPGGTPIEEVADAPPSD